MDLEGATIGQYQIIEQIGKGGMATVYKAYQPNLDRYVAVKVLAPDLVEAEELTVRFEREARAIARLRHRNILTVFDYGCQEGLFYLAMEYVSRGTLRDRLGWPQNLAYAASIISQVGDALAHAHRQGMIHRDVKPANILMVEDDWPLLSDFGLAKLVEDSLQLTASGAGVGTPQYMSPEQAQGLVVDRRSDIYSLGVMLYEAVTGRPPFGTDSPVALILRHISDPVPPPRTLRSDLPEEMERTILKALAKSPDDRYQRMEEFLADLREAYPFPVGGVAHRGSASALRRSPAIPAPSRRPILPRRRAFPWARLVIGVLLLLTVTLTFLFFKTSKPPSIPQLFPTTAAVATPPTVTATPQPSPTAAVAAVLPTVASPTATLPTVATVTATPQPSPTATAVATPTVIKLRVWEADGAEMVFVPAGEFVMGSEELGDDERPVHQVYLDEFWIDRYEVTNERFARFVDATGYRTEAETRGRGWLWKGSESEEVEGADWRHPRGPGSSIEGKQDHPVTLVSWNDADAYCRWAKKRLPSEAQWEKAARGPAGPSPLPSPAPHGRRYPWGDEFDSARANTKESGRGDTTPVGSFSPQGDSPYGASDLAGNVWEWVADWYGSDYYSQSPLPTVANPTGPATGTYKILRGGSWLFDAVYANTAFRYNIKPDYTYDFAGFRCSSQ
jgi:formylglycine-generating enzyme required for sulfatase activity/serine/threonine protein kinase